MKTGRVRREGVPRRSTRPPRKRYFRRTMAHTDHAELKRWVDETARLAEPDRVYWVDGSEQERVRLTKRAIARGFLIPLDQERFPGCYYSRSNPNDVARTEHLTYICTKNKKDVGPTNNWMAPDEGYAKSKEI